jgi:drug/metabolite transporter (DMT)-like permease
MNRRIVLGYVFSLATGLCYGITNVLVRIGVSSHTTPMVGTTIALSAGMVILSIVGFKNLSFPVGSDKNSKKGIILFALCGFTSFLGVYTGYFALQLAPMITVSPLISTNPLVTLCLAYLILRKSEKITLSMKPIGLSNCY